MNNIFAFVLAILLMLQNSIVIFAESSNEVPEYVKLVQNLGIMTGYEDGTFRGTNVVTRGEFAAVVVNWLFSEEHMRFNKSINDLEKAYLDNYVNNEQVFSDVSVGHWSFKYVNYVSSKKFMLGYDNGNFGVDDELKLLQAIIILMRAYHEESKPYYAVYSYYTEKLGLSEEEAYMCMAGDIGLIYGLENVSYNTPCTRDMLAKLLYNYLFVDYNPYGFEAHKTKLESLGIDVICNAVVEYNGSEYKISDDLSHIKSDDNRLKPFVGKKCTLYYSAIQDGKIIYVTQDDYACRLINHISKCNEKMNYLHYIDRLQKDKADLNEQEFLDVDNDNARYVKFVTQIGVCNGYEDKTFKGQNIITRGELAAISTNLNYYSLLRMREGYTYERWLNMLPWLSALYDTEPCFSDVPSSHWAFGYVTDVVNNGVMFGYGDGSFGVNDGATFVQVIMVLLRGKIVPGGNPVSKNDDSSYRSAADALGITAGLENAENSTPCTRYMVSKLIFNLANTDFDGVKFVMRFNKIAQ